MADSLLLGPKEALKTAHVLSQDFKLHKQFNPDSSLLVDLFTQSVVSDSQVVTSARNTLKEYNAKKPQIAFGILHHIFDLASDDSGNFLSEEIFFEKLNRFLKNKELPNLNLFDAWRAYTDLLPKTEQQWEMLKTGCRDVFNSDERRKEAYLAKIENFKNQFTDDSYRKKTTYTESNSTAVPVTGFEASPFYLFHLISTALSAESPTEALSPSETNQHQLPSAKAYDILENKPNAAKFLSDLFKIDSPKQGWLIQLKVYFSSSAAQQKQMKNYRQFHLLTSEHYRPFLTLMVQSEREKIDAERKNKWFLSRFFFKRQERKLLNFLMKQLAPEKSLKAYVVPQNKNVVFQQKMTESSQGKSTADIQNNLNADSTNVVAMSLPHNLEEEIVTSLVATQELPDLPEASNDSQVSVTELPDLADPLVENASEQNLRIDDLLPINTLQDDILHKQEDENLLGSEYRKKRDSDQAVINWTKRNLYWPPENPPSPSTCCTASDNEDAFGLGESAVTPKNRVDEQAQGSNDGINHIQTPLDSSDEDVNCLATPLSAASSSSYVDMSRTPLAGSDIQVNDSETPLSVASSGSNVDTTGTPQEGADIQVDNNETPLSVASSGSDVDTTGTPQEGADIQVDNNETPPSVASSGSNVDTTGTQQEGADNNATPLSPNCSDTVSTRSSLFSKRNIRRVQTNLLSSFNATTTKEPASQSENAQNTPLTPGNR